MKPFRLPLRFPSPTRLSAHPLSWAIAAALGLGLLTAGMVLQRGPLAADAPATAAPKPALTVSVVPVQTRDFGLGLTANGNVAAWQEASVGSEASGLRLAEVLVNVGDRVQAGQPLARFAAETVQADLAQARAALAEAQATAQEATANAERARGVQASGALSAQQIGQFLSAEASARARVDLAQAQLQQQQLRLKHTEVRAPDAGVISARSATVGAVLPAGTELFRLVRQSRLEWRAEVTGTELLRLQPGATARVQGPGGDSVTGRVRAVAPTVDPQTRNGLVYVDLPAAPAQAAGLRAGMFARGEFELGRSPGLAVPASAVVLRDGFSHVFTLVEGDRVRQVKVRTGRRQGDQVEVLEGLPREARVVAQGAAFLNDNDRVKVVTRSPAP